MFKSANTFIFYYHLWIITCVGQSCVPQSLEYSLTKDQQHQLLPQLKDGFQAILPDNAFSCSGLLKEVVIQATGESEFELQLWRPVDGSLYTKVWGEGYQLFSTTGTFKRIAKDTLQWTVLDSIGIPVKAGDVFGFYIHEAKTPIQFVYSNSIPSTLYYIKSTHTLCNMSLCDSHMRRLTRTSPFITATVFGATQDPSFTETRHSLTPPSCSQIHHRRNSSKRTRLTRQTPPTNSTTISSTSTFPSATVMPTSTPSAGTDMTSSPPGFVVKISPEAIVFIIVGIVLLVVLVVLVFVLVACLRTKGMKVEQSSSLLVNSPRIPDAESVDSRITASTRLASSVEQSVSSNEAISTRNPPSRSASHHYINGEISHKGVFSSFYPQYVNSPLTQSTSHDHLRSERVWSTSALHGRHIHPHNGRYRAKSVEPSAKLCIGIQAPPVPPRGQVKTSVASSEVPTNRTQNKPQVDHLKIEGGTAPANRYSMLEMSGDYADPISPQEWTRSHSCAARMGSRVNGQPSHDYAEPVTPSALKEGLLESLKYDRLSPKEGSPQFDLVTTGSLVPGPRERGSMAASEDHLYSDPDRLSNGDTLEQSFNYSFVPTEDQRRMIMNVNHYEMQDDFEDSTGGYDRLRYFEERETYWAPATTESGLYTQLYENKYRELPRSEIKVIRQIGSGNFGTVSVGVWENGVDREPVEVAIKTVKASTELERVKLLQEAAIMGQFAHCNVVRLLGVVTVGDPALVILEYMTRGDLRSFLQKLHPKVSKRELPDVLPRLFIKFSKDIANGMSYLSKKSFVHRDLAARNILLTRDLTCKIGDFGMARDIENDYYKSHGGIIPVKWTAPEALNYNKFSSASDVWSYGMVLFEIWSLGEKPFNDLTNPIVIALVSSKHCQAPPPGCPRAIYHLMVECWNPDASNRPTFDSIYTYLDSPLENLTYWHPSDLIPDKKAHVLSAPLREANNLYIELQRTYQKPLIENCT